MAVRCGSAAVRAGARRAVMAVSGESRTPSLPQRVAGVKLPGPAAGGRVDARKTNRSQGRAYAGVPGRQRSIAMGISRYATARWQGDLKTGKGHLSTPASGLLADTPYGFNTRFG